MTKLKRKNLKASAMALLFLMASPFAMAVPEGINYQAYLTNADGTAVDTTISITFAAYNVDFGGVPLWSQTESVVVDNGLFSVTLGSPANMFPAGLFDNPVYIGLFVAGEEMLPRRQLNSVAFARKAGDADTLQGATAASLDQSSEVSALQGDISSVESALVTVDGRVSTLEGIGADITGVSAGAGLTGGGASGNVTVGVAPGGINASMMGANSVNSFSIVDNSIIAGDIAQNAVGSSEIAANAVGSSELVNGGVFSIDIADGSILPADIASNQNYTVGGLEVNGSTDLNGALEITSGADIVINDEFNGFRWYSSDGSTQWGAILMRATEASFWDATRSRYAVHSDAGGVGIGTTLTATGYDVSVPSLSVAGQTSVGLQVVSSNYALDATTTQCHAHGNLPCYYGVGQVTCPVGKRVLGGGTSGTNARYGAIGQSLPNGVTGWNCSASYDLINNTRNCYAICARLE